MYESKQTVCQTEFGQMSVYFDSAVGKSVCGEATCVIPIQVENDVTGQKLFINYQLSFINYSLAIVFRGRNK
jgi:hypothetical protein